jgi:hypothetical protein
MPTFDVTFVPAVPRRPLDPGWTSATERVEAVNPEAAVEPARQAWARNTPAQAHEAHVVKSIIQIA